MLTSFSCTFVYYRYIREGYTSDLYDYISMTAITYFIISPFIIFQALMCKRDDEQLNHDHVTITTTEAVCPILIVLGFVWVALAIFGMTARSTMQVNNMFIIYIYIYNEYKQNIYNIIYIYNIHMYI
jgi:hypothetical protein